MKAEEIAPVLRGLTFNGTTGAVVSFRADESTGAGVLAVESAEQLKAKGKIAADIETVSVKGIGSFDLNPARKVAIVTGGAQGFGAGLVREMVVKDIFVFIADMNLKGAESFASELNAEYGKDVAAGSRGECRR